MQEKKPFSPSMNSLRTETNDVSSSDTDFGLKNLTSALSIDKTAFGGASSWETLFRY